MEKYQTCSFLFIRLVKKRETDIKYCFFFQLAKYVSTDEDMDAVEMHEPYTYLNGLTVDDLEDLLVDINVYRFF